MFRHFNKALNGEARGFTLIELVVVLAILGILIALAVPRYLGARKKAYKAEADNILQESKTLEWAYYQQYNLFDTTGASIGIATPGGMHWGAPTFGGTANGSVSIQMTGGLTRLGQGTACGSCYTAMGRPAGVLHSKQPVSARRSSGRVPPGSAA